MIAQSDIGFSAKAGFTNESFASRLPAFYVMSGEDDSFS